MHHQSRTAPVGRSPLLYPLASTLPCLTYSLTTRSLAVAITTSDTVSSCQRRRAIAPCLLTILHIDNPAYGEVREWPNRAVSKSVPSLSLKCLETGATSHKYWRDSVSTLPLVSSCFSPFPHKFFARFPPTIFPHSFTTLAQSLTTVSPMAYSCRRPLAAGSPIAPSCGLFASLLE